MSSYKLWVEKDGELHAGPVVLTEGDVFTVVVPDMSSAESVAIATELQRQMDQVSVLSSRLWECEHRDDD